SSYVLLMLFFSLSYSALLYTLSFPTRRSSDLAHIGDVLVHLLDQAVHIGEGDLPADAGDELEGHLPVVDVEGSELLVENVRLDPAGAAFERRIRAHRDRRRVGLSFAGESRPPGVDSVCGHEPFGVIGQVRRREAEVAAAGVAVDDGAVNGVVAAELIGHLGDIAGGELFADARGRIAAPTSDLVDRLGP